MRRGSGGNLKKIDFNNNKTQYLLFEKKQKESLLFFGAKKRSKRSIHPSQAALWGESWGVYLAVH